jgi:phytoene/squalene synthetase
MALPPEALEALWRRLAEAIDRAGPAHDRVMLAKLALLLAEEVGDPALVERLIEAAGRDLCRNS